MTIVARFFDSLFRGIFLCSGIETADPLIVFIAIAGSIRSVFITVGGPFFAGFLTRFLLPRVLHLLQEIGDSPVVHSFEAGKRQGRLVADGQKDDRIAWRDGLQFEVKQPFVKDADVFAGEV